jgi:hypothetical protein
MHAWIIVQNWLRSSYVSILSRSHDLPPHPCHGVAPALLVTCAHAGSGGAAGAVGAAAGLRPSDCVDCSVPGGVCEDAADAPCVECPGAGLLLPRRGFVLLPAARGGGGGGGGYPAVRRVARCPW